jgi:hypothetical protein
MRYLRKYESHEDIHAICREYDISDYTNLEGCPKWVGGSFYCRDNNIETFEGLEIIRGSYKV